MLIEHYDEEGWREKYQKIEQVLANIFAMFVCFSHKSK